jgi:hypothetical protein
VPTRAVLLLLHPALLHITVVFSDLASNNTQHLVLDNPARSLTS